MCFAIQESQWSQHQHLIRQATSGEQIKLKSLAGAELQASMLGGDYKMEKQF